MSSNFPEITSIKLHSSLRSGGSISAPIFRLSESINNISALKVKSFTMPLSNYLIDSRNDKIYFKEGVTSFTASLTHGNYISVGTQSNSFAVQIDTALEAAGAYDYTVSINDITNILTISSTSGNFSIEDGINNAYYEMGIVSSQFSNSASSITASEPIDLSGVKEISIISNIAGVKLFNSHYNILATISLEEDLTSISNFIDDSSDYILTKNRFVDTIYLQFLDDRNRSLTVNKDFSIVINFITDS